MEIYIHIPFCVKKCAYCDFLSVPSTFREREDYVKALCHEIRMAGAFCHGKTSENVTSLFFGGGTPSLLSIRQIERILDTLRRYYEFRPGAEITLEANPGTVTLKQLGELKRLGINRLSLGLQSALDEELKCLGRIHTYGDFLNTYESARKAGFENINVDLMSALPGQRPESYEKSLRTVVHLKPEHISAYSLIVEPGTCFGKLAEEGKLLLPTEDEEIIMDRMSLQLLSEAGYRRYEISNYALPGYECRHNLGYWKREDYLGFGLGASSLVHPVRFTNTTDYISYLKQYLLEDPCPKEEEDRPLWCRQPKSFYEEWQILGIREQMEEFFFLGLRMSDGVSNKVFKELFGVSIFNVYGDAINRHLSDKSLVLTDSGVALTEKGMALSNPVLADFLWE